MLVLALCVIVVALARQIGTLHLRLGPRGALEVDDEGPRLGDSAPAETTRDLQGRELTIGERGRSQLLLFVSPGCRVCDEVLPALPVIARQYKLAPFLITDADRSEAAAAYDSKTSVAPLIADQDVVRSYRVPGTPYVVVVDDAGVVRAKGTVNTLEQMEGLVETALARATSGSGVGEPAR